MVLDVRDIPDARFTPAYMLVDQRDAVACPRSATGIGLRQAVVVQHVATRPGSDSPCVVNALSENCHSWCMEILESARQVSLPKQQWR